MHIQHINIAVLQLQLCRGGSVTNLVKSLRKKGKYLDEDLIAYILYETLKVTTTFCKFCYILHEQYSVYYLIIVFGGTVSSYTILVVVVIISQQMIQLSILNQSLHFFFSRELNISTGTMLCTGTSKALMSC